jgi:hypothetical protein
LKETVELIKKEINKTIMRFSGEVISKTPIMEKIKKRKRLIKAVSQKLNETEI